MRRAWYIVAAMTMWVLPAGAQVRPSVSAHTDTDAISVGDRLTLTIAVRHAPGQEVAWPAPADTLGPFEVLGTRAGEPEVSDNDLQTSTQHYVLTAFELGELQIPALDVAVSDSAGAEPEILLTEPISVVVESVGVDESGDIRTVKAPLQIPRNWLLLIPWLLLIGALVGVGYWLYRRYRAREKPSQPSAELREPARPAHEVAYEALDRLEEKRLLERGEIKQFFIEVSEILRAYLEARYPIDALEMTSYEVLRELERVGLEPAVYDLFPPFFDRADLVKFAKHRPDMSACREMIPMARRLVDGTRAPDRAQAEQELAGKGKNSDAATVNSGAGVS